jgi:TonB family protein
MNKVVAVVLSVIIASLAVCAQSSTKPRHCSVARGSEQLQYPDSFKGSGIQGAVSLEAVIDQNGCAHDVRVGRKLHPELDEIARQTVGSWIFSPATKDGKPVTVKIQIQVEFKDNNK